MTCLLSQHQKSGQVDRVSGQLKGYKTQADGLQQTLSKLKADQATEAEKQQQNNEKLEQQQKAAERRNERRNHAIRLSAEPDYYGNLNAGLSDLQHYLEESGDIELGGLAVATNPILPNSFDMSFQAEYTDPVQVQVAIDELEQWVATPGAELPPLDGLYNLISYGTQVTKMAITSAVSRCFNCRRDGYVA